MTRSIPGALALAALLIAAGSADAKPTPVKVKKVTCATGKKVAAQASCPH